MTTVVLDSGALTAWARPTPPMTLLAELEAAQRAGGGVVVPTIVVVESTMGEGPRDAAVNWRVKFASTKALSLDLARVAARLRTSTQRAVSAADAVVAATASLSHGAVVVTSDPDDLGALCSAVKHPIRVVRV